ncbi:uncharacterized protein LOC121055214 [Oryza brachyantha]|uniref:uncharacterized protein LOC121055214 n=1 Tax=Oryza brachyantha TaxID=4533 RepID=UPI001AD9A6C4|nr:uncharacterized protein LOC121055214 [Oryza brachyantha]
MGGSYSHSHSHSHPAQPCNHALKRAGCGNLGGAACGLCGKQVGHSDMAYRCTAARCTSPSFFLHEACYRYPARIRNHFSGHSLALAARAGVTARVCAVCAMPLDGFSCVYSCRQSRHSGCATAGFGAHPRCANLPQKATDPSHGHQLVLRASETGAGGGRRCVRCNKIAAGPAWSYQCPTCRDVGFCLRCVLGKDDDRPQCCCACGAAPAGFAMGIFLRGLLRGFTGL